MFSKFELLKIKSNGTFEYDGTVYHKNQYVRGNPLYNPKINEACAKNPKNYKIKFKDKRTCVTPLLDSNEEFIIKPLRVNSITHSQSAANYNFKSHKKVALNKKLYVEVMKFFFKRLVYYMIQSGNRIKLPYVKLGSLQICQVKSKGGVKKYVNFAESKKQHKTVLDSPNKLLNGYKPYMKHFVDKDRVMPNGMLNTLRTDNTTHATHYTWRFIRTVFRPNSYNKTNHELTLVTFFNTEGYKFYHKLE